MEKNLKWWNQQNKTFFDFCMEGILWMPPHNNFVKLSMFNLSYFVFMWCSNSWKQKNLTLSSLKQQQKRNQYRRPILQRQMKLSHAIHNTVFQESWCDTRAKIPRKTVLYSCSDNAVLLQAQA